MSDASSSVGVNESAVVDVLKAQIALLHEELKARDMLDHAKSILSSNTINPSIKSDEDQKLFSSLSTDQINKMIAIQKLIGSIHLNFNESGIQLLKDATNPSQLSKYKQRVITYLKGKRLLFTILDFYDNENLLTDPSNINLLIKNEVKSLVYAFLSSTLSFKLQSQYVRPSNKEDPKILWNNLMVADVKQVDPIKLINNKNELLQAFKYQFNEKSSTTAQHLSRLDAAFTEHQHMVDYYNLHKDESGALDIGNGDLTDTDKIITLAASITNAASLESSYQTLYGKLLKIHSYTYACAEFIESVGNRLKLLDQLHRNKINLQIKQGLTIKSMDENITGIGGADPAGTVNAVSQPMVCRNCGKKGHKAGQKTLNGYQYICRAEIVQCSKCNWWGHQDRFCKNPKSRYVKKDQFPNPNIQRQQSNDNANNNKNNNNGNNNNTKDNYKDHSQTDSNSSAIDESTGGLLRNKLQGKGAVVIGRTASVIRPSKNNDNNYTLILDTACTHHAICNRKLFTNLRPVRLPYVVEVANGEFVESTEVGDVHIPTDSGDQLVLYNAYYFPTFNMNLISWPSLDNANFALTIQARIATIYYKEEGTLIECLKMNQIDGYKCYEYDINPRSSSLSSADNIQSTTTTVLATVGRGDLIQRYMTVHRQYGHAHAGDISKLAKLGVIPSSILSYNESQKIIGMQVKCDDCNAAKAKTRSINDHSLRPVTTQPMERISADCFILGKINFDKYLPEYTNIWDFAGVVSGILDEDSGVAEVAMVPSTGHATPHLINYLKRYSRVADNGIPIVKTTINADNAYLNHQIKEFTEKCGFNLSIVPPYSHQNVLIEQYWRRLKGSTKAAMRLARAPMFTVNYFMKAINFQLNLLINPKYDCTKFQRFHSFPPRSGVAHTPGCDVLVKYEQGEKFSLQIEKMHTEEAYLCAFLYPDFAYDQQMDTMIVYDPLRNRIIRRRNCGPFYEDQFTVMHLLSQKSMASDSDTENSSDSEPDNNDQAIIIHGTSIDDDIFDDIFNPSADEIARSNQFVVPPVDSERLSQQQLEIQRMIEAQEAQQNINQVEQYMRNDRAARMARREATVINRASSSSPIISNVVDDNASNSDIPAPVNDNLSSHSSAPVANPDTHSSARYNPRLPTFYREHNTRSRRTNGSVHTAVKYYHRIAHPNAVIYSLQRRDQYVPMKEALNGPERDQFRAALKNEVDMFEEFKVFIRYNIHDVPRDATILPLLVLFSRKYDENGNIKKHKCRIALRGDQQTEEDYDEISSPVISPIAKKIILALAVQYGLCIIQVDFKCAYLHAKMDTIMFVRIPPGIGIEGCDDPNNVYLLDKALYGAKQSGLLFNKKVIKFMTSQGFIPSTFDKCLFFKITNSNNLFIIGLYVDDGEIAYHINDQESDYLPFMEALGKEFKIGEAGQAKWLLGTKIDYDQKEGLLELTQSAFIDKTLSKLNLSNATPISTPSVKYSADDNHSDTNTITIGIREAVGALNWLMTTTRPDITFSVNQVARHVNNPQPIHHKMIKRIGRYLAGTKDIGLFYRKVKTEDFKVRVFVDAAFDTNSHSKSQTGFFIMLGGCNIYSKSSGQKVVAQSSAEAEYMAAADASNAAIGIRETVNEMLIKLRPYSTIPIIEMFSDSSAAIQIASGTCDSSVKHILRRYHVLRQRVEEGDLIIHHLDTNKQPADSLTKSLTAEKFIPFRDQVLGYFPIEHIVNQ